MKFINGEMRPGVVLEVLDNKGSIKAAVPGLFSREDQDVLPPIIPWPSGGSLNSFSTPKVHDEVWVIFFIDNPEQLFWLRKDDFSKVNGEYSKNSTSGSIQDQKGVQIMANIESGAGWATIYFNDGSGWIIKNQEAIIQLDQDGKIILSNNQPHGTIEINDDGISLGSPNKSLHPVPLGDKVQEVFENIIDLFKSIQQVANTNPYTKSIGMIIEKNLPDFENAPQYINSDYVTID